MGLKVEVILECDHAQCGERAKAIADVTYGIQTITDLDVVLPVGWYQEVKYFYNAAMRFLCPSHSPPSI